MKKEVIVGIQLPYKHYNYIYNHDCKYNDLAFHSHSYKLNRQCQLRNHMLDLSWKLDHVRGFKTLSKIITALY